MRNHRFSFDLRFVDVTVLETAHRIPQCVHECACEFMKSKDVKNEQNCLTNVHICSSPNKSDFGLVKTTIYL